MILKNKKSYRKAIKATFSLLLLATLFCSFSANAGLLTLDAGIGNDNTNESNAVFARFQEDTDLLLWYDSFYEITVGAWDGPSKNQIIGISRGVYLTSLPKNYISISGGVGLVANETIHLGTHFQFLFRLAFGRKFGKYDVAISQYHISNGKNIFGWNGPNVSENFLTLQFGWELDKR